jgi:glycosyltransferase 2 family protein
MPDAVELNAPAGPLTPERERRWSGAHVLSLVISTMLLVILYRSVDARLVGGALLAADPAWLVLSIGMIVPITVMRAIRFYYVAPAGALPGIGEALRLTLVASALNVVVPAKAGDLVKSYFVARRSGTATGVALAIIVYERLCDVLGLVFWCLVGWFAAARPRTPALPSALWLSLGAVGLACAALVVSQRLAALLAALPAKALRFRKLQQLAAGWPDLLGVLGARRGWIVLFTLVLWLTHLFQIWLFTVTLAVPVPFAICASFAALALIAGQLPFTLAGLGVRDVALVVLLSGYMAPAYAAALGVLIATRTIVPPLLGMPLIGPYLTTAVQEARRWRRETTGTT